MRLPGGDLPARIAERLHALDYTVEGVRRLLGGPVAAAFERGETLPASHALSGERAPLATLVRFFMLAEPVDLDDLEAAVGVAPAELAGLVQVQGAQVTSLVDLSPCAIDDRDWFVASDWSSPRTGRPTTPDHVLGVGGASLMLARCAVRAPVPAALDIGTGCGIQALELRGHCERVVGTDVSARCLDFARFNAAINGVPLELRQGSLFDPVADERFDLIVSNPPFVIGSPAPVRHDYRDFGGDGDAACREVVTGAEARLTEGGWCQLLANWEIHDVDDWSQRPREWVQASGLDAWVIQREVQDPVEYVQMWLRDAGEQSSVRYAIGYDEWLSTLEARGVVAIGFGLVNLRRGVGHDPVRRFQHVPQQWAQPVATEIEQWFSVQDWLATDPSGPLTTALAVADDVVLESHRWTSDEPVTLLRRTGGMRWSGPIDTFGLDVLRRLEVAGIAAEAVASAAEAHDVPVAEALERSVPVLGRLLEEGFVQRGR